MGVRPNSYRESDTGSRFRFYFDPHSFTWLVRHVSHIVFPQRGQAFKGPSKAWPQKPQKIPERVDKPLDREDETTIRAPFGQVGGKIEDSSETVRGI